MNEMIVDKLDIVKDIPFERVHRLNAKADSPIIACFSSFKDKDRVMRAKSKLKDTGIFIGDDLPLPVREIRKKLVPHLKTARSENKKASMVYDHLIIEGKKYTVDGKDKLYQYE